MVGNDRERILSEAGKMLRGEIPQGRAPQQWDGHVAERIVAILLAQAELGC